MKGAKFCTKCNTWKDGSAFYVTRCAAHCIECRKAYAREYYQKHKAECNERTRSDYKAKSPHYISLNTKNRRKRKRLALIAAIAKRKAESEHVAKK